jgi:hypothetical protein
MNLYDIKETKWMMITCIKDTGKTKTYALHSKDGNFHLGTVAWFSRWRQYAFMPYGETVFEKQCLQDIVDFLKELMLERKLSDGK